LYFFSLFFLFLFSFFLNHEIIDLGTKSCMQLALWYIKNVNSKNYQKKQQNSNNTCKKLSKRDHQNPVASPSMTNKAKVK